MKRFLVLSTLVLSLTLPASPQSPPIIHESVVVTASAVEEPTSITPASVTVIERADIDRQKARDVADVLRQVPGLTLSRTGSSGKATSLFTRGGNSTHTLVLLDGVPINNPYFAGYDWGRFSTAGVEKIEVVRGPFSALYGSDAMSGVINIRTVSATPEFSLQLEGGEQGLANGSLTAGYASQGSRARISVERREDDGWNDNDDFAQDSGIASVTLGSQQSSIGLTARYTNYELGIPFNTDASGSIIVPSPARRQEGSELQTSVPIRFSTGANQIDLTLAESSRDDDFSDPDDPFGLTDASTESKTRRARLSIERRLPNGVVIIGGEWERAEVEDVSTYGVNLDSQRRTAKSAFVENRTTRPLGNNRSIEISSGVRYDDYDTFGTELSPRMAIAVINGPLKIRAAYGEAFRAPSLGELYFPFSGNTALEPEESKSTELGVEHTTASSVWSLTLFNSEYENLIQFDNLTFTFQNIGAATARGAELGARHQFASGLFTSLSYTWLDTNEKATDQQLLRRPEHSGSLEVGFHRGGITTEVIAIHNGGRDDVLPVYPYSRAANESHTTFDALLSYRIGRVEPYVRLENATDEQYEEVLGFLSPGRRAIAGVRFSTR